MGALHTGHLRVRQCQQQVRQRHTHGSVPRSHPFTRRQRVRPSLNRGLHRRKEALATKDVAAGRDRGVGRRRETDGACIRRKRLHFVDRHRVDGAPELGFCLQHRVGVIVLCVRGM